MKRLFSQLHRPLRNERGEITFFACFFVVGVVMLISFLLLYGRPLVVGRHTKVSEMSSSLQKRLLDNGISHKELDEFLEHDKEVLNGCRGFTSYASPSSPLDS